MLDTMLYNVKEDKIVNVEEEGFPTLLNIKQK
jgi:hypothetical protein